MCPALVVTVPLFVLVLGAVGGCDNMPLSDQGSPTPELSPVDKQYCKRIFVVSKHFISKIHQNLTKEVLVYVKSGFCNLSCVV